MKPVVIKMMDLSKFETSTLEQKYEIVAKDSLRAKEAKAMITFGTLGPSREQLMEFPNVGLICVLGVGYETVDVKAAAEKNVKVANGKGTNANAVADHTMGLVIAIARNIPFNDRQIRAGRWKQETRPQLADMHLGLYGLGDIGEHIAKRASAFNMKVSYFNRTKRGDLPYTYVPSLKELAAQADYLVVTVPGSSETKHSVNTEILNELGADGFLIAISRGVVVDTDDLIKALQTKAIAGAALDVLESEPEVPDELRKLDNVILTPHMAGVSPESLRAMIEMCERNLDAFFEGHPLANEVKP